MAEKEASSESFQIGLKSLLDRHPELRPYVPVASRWTELIETYGDALMAKAKWQSDTSDHEMILDHYVAVCDELEATLLANFRAEGW
ncbi:hypothetical protein FHX15_001897 [Rhizobium sp. BK650]|uniref:hypothetical protein n=1 Tax=Rhizobium sp. BK650 TaxID=2586990 RepID=UPI00160D46ED|nr:hypothetical protein [Rhizobium sp. BK650]MBB3656669.1 hypothetical protein [Rhizobium sp. BK650]